MAGFTFTNSGREARIIDKLGDLNWGLIAIVSLISLTGCVMLYSVAGGNIDPWASRHATRFAAGLVILITVALIDIRIWMSLAYPSYALSLILLVAVEVAGETGKGAERWLNLGLIQIQPSELMKIALILALSRYFHGLTRGEVSRFFNLIPPALMIGIPAGLVLLQPNLGTATILGLVGFGLLFLSGLSWRYIVPLIAGGVAAVPVGWLFLHDYQRQRVLTFLNPEDDPLGAGYNILQSKIALGSGGLFGKGFLNGTQSQLNFLPEKHTDFIFVMFGEEFGLFGGLLLLSAYLVTLAYGVAIAMQARSQFARLVAMGVTINFLLYILINVSMVMGLIPVVGIPLPLMSYGGTAMITVMFGFGLLMSVHLHRNIEIARHSGAFW